MSKHIQTQILFLWCTTTCVAQSNNSLCTPSSCGSTTITYPFRLTTDSANCGHHDSTFILDCRHNQTTILRLKSRQYHVQSITYTNFSIRLSDPGLDSHNYSSCPLYSSPDNYLYSSYMNSVSTSSSVTFLSCLKPVDNPFYAPDPFCGNGSSRYVTARSVSVSELEDVCTYETSMGSAWPLGGDGKYSYSEIHDVMAYGVEMSWFRVHCEECYGKNGDCVLEDGRVRCRYRYSCYEIASLPPDSLGCKLVFYGLYAIYVGMAIGAFIGLRLLLGIPFLIALVVNKWKTRRSSMQQSEINREISRLRADNFLPINYTRGEIKRMTESFESKLLGENLFRGKLKTGPSVAIKMLASSSGTDKDFISRVFKLSRIDHPNIMRIVGFCIEGKERAVVYSPLDLKHVPLQEKMDDSTPLKYRDILKIALGIASGTRCLHEVGIFDIRAEPRNVMLDEEMNPKILSDCGLEKTGRGKTGFIAPEIFYENVGEITCKADVYGFGMVILEMAARVEYGNKAGPVYFPYWAYEQLSEGAELEIVDADEEEVMMVRKTILVGLWCIQMRAGDRPLMSDVVDMLRGGVEKLGMPPMPFQTVMEGCSY